MRDGAPKDEVGGRGPKHQKISRKRMQRASRPGVPKDVRQPGKVASLNLARASGRGRTGAKRRSGEGKSAQASRCATPSPAPTLHRRTYPRHPGERHVTHAHVPVARRRSLLWHGSALADSIALTLNRTSIAGQGDSLGTTQHWYGIVKKGNTAVGNFYILIRTDQVAIQLPAGLTQIWLIFPTAGGNPAPESLVIEGMNDTASSKFKGSVSAASNKYKWARDATAVYTPVPSSPADLKLVIEGSFTGVTLP